MREKDVPASSIISKYSINFNILYPTKYFKSSYTKNAGHTIALSKPTTPIQNVVAVDM